ncbi:MAG: phosphoribosyltransferase [Elainella sp. Prado103]|jgi:putative phosphoribosyl transferase|nr:phosphoribosyltransferase [Elainella sp. Prado103]
MERKFRDRTEAGQLLAAQLQAYAHCPNGLVLALPRGGVPVAYEIAEALNLPLDVCLVRKLGVPGQEELAMGAIAPGGVMILNNEVLRMLHLSRQTLLQVANIEKRELERRQRVYQSDRPLPIIRDRTIILVDDGIATSSTLRAAITVLQRQRPQQIIVAVPVMPIAIYASLKKLVQQVISLSMPEPLRSIGQWYEDFSQTSDAEVCHLLKQASIRQMECSLG